jgi:hypothetical protein
MADASCGLEEAIMMKLTATIAILGGAMTYARVGHADDGPSTYAWHDPELRSGIGVSALLGSGITTFTYPTMRDTTSPGGGVGGLWDLRVTVGSHTPLAVEVGYVGTLTNIDALIGTQRGTLIGTTVEGAVRFNVLPHADWNPYAFTGIGWQRYDITGGNFNLSDTGMVATDTSVVFPMGAGICYRSRTGLVFDVRGTFRPNAGAKLVLDAPGSTTYATMNTWEASGAVGYEL